MQDLIFLGVFAGFLALCFGYVRVCDKVVGPIDQPADRERS